MEINVVNSSPDTIKVSVTTSPTVKVSSPTVRTVSAIIPQGAKGDQGPAGPAGAAGADGTDGLGFTGGSYNASTGVVTFTSDDGLGFTTSDLRGADGQDGTNGTNGTDGTDGLGFTGGSYNSGTGIVTFTSDDGLGFSTSDLRGADGTNGTDGSTQYGVVSSEPTSAADFTFDGIDHDIVFDESATSTVAYMYGLNSAGTAIYRWSGSRRTILILDVTNFSLQNSSGSTISSGTNNIYEIGATTNEWQSNCQGFNATYNNVAGGTLSGTNQISVSNRSSSQTWGSSALTIETADLTGTAPTQTLVDFRDGATEANFDVYYPNDTTWDSSARKSLGFTLSAADGSNTDSTSLTFYFKNRVFYGGSSNSSLTSSDIIGLSNSPFTGSDFTLGSTSISTTGTQYVYYCYPSRFSGTPTFVVNGFNTAFTQLTDVSVTNSSGYVESYEVYQSPQQYTDATLTLQVTT